MNVLLRILGFNVLAHVGSRLPSGLARTITSTVLIAANLLPVLAVLTGDAGVGDVFLIYWFENVVVWITTTIKILTARGAEVSDGRTYPASGNFIVAALFALQFGLFTLVHGVLSLALAHITGGFTGDPKTWLLLMLAITASHLISLGFNWFGQGERNVATVLGTMAMPWPRMVVLHASVIGAIFFVLIGLGVPDNATDAVVPVALLCGLKTTVDVVFHLRERAANRHVADTQDGEAVTPG